MRKCYEILLTAVSALLAENATAATEVLNSAKTLDALQRPAYEVRINPSSLAFNDVTRIDGRIISVGERGAIFLSDDNGNTWRQAKVPVSVTLAAVKFQSAKHGWAVGHSGVVLHTTDRGDNWTVQLDGKQAIDLLQKAAASRDSTPVDAGMSISKVRFADQMRDDGPDKPFLDVAFNDSGVGYVVGAYGLIFRSENWGASWAPWDGYVENPKGAHLYSVSLVDKKVYLAGEQGFFAVSVDQGQKFKKTDTPYRGTYFSLAALKQGGVVIGGMRGHAYATTNDGKNWTEISDLPPASVTKITQLSNSNIRISTADGRISDVRLSGMPPLRAIGVSAVGQHVAAIAELNGSALLAVGLRGMKVIKTDTSKLQNNNPEAK